MGIMTGTVASVSQQSQMYASMFTLACFLVHGFPIFSSVYMCADRNVQVWIGYWPLLSLVWVLVFCIAHVFHLRYGRPKKSLMMVCMFAPAVWFFLSGWMLLSDSTHYYTVLQSSECERVPKVAALNEAYLEAKAFHASCLKAERKSAMLIHYCSGYDRAEGRQPETWTWEYLRFAEKNFGCAGFCDNNQPTLWTYQGVAKDGCSGAIGNVLGRKVHKMAVCMMTYSVLVVIVFLLWVELVGPSMNYYGSLPSSGSPGARERLSTKSKLLPGGSGPLAGAPQQQAYGGAAAAVPPPMPQQQAVPQPMPVPPAASQGFLPPHAAERALHVAERARAAHAAAGASPEMAHQAAQVAYMQHAHAEAQQLQLQQQ